MKKFLLIVAVVAVVGVLAIGGVWLIVSCATLFCNEVHRSAFITASSAMLGGLCTLVGVAITIRVDARFKKRTYKEACKPEIYVPDRYDLAQAIKVSLIMKGESARLGTLSEYASYSLTVCLKNSDKASFNIIQVEAGERVLEPRIVSHIEKGDLFCLCFYNIWDATRLSVTVRGADDSYYSFFILVRNDGPFIEEVVEKDVRKSDR